MSSDDESVNILSDEYASGGILNIKDFSNDLETKKSRQSGHLIQIELTNGKNMLVKKKTVCWLFQNQYTKISTDRLQRFKGCTSSRKKILTIAIEKEQYYAVYYEEKWYIGRVLDITQKIKLKFLCEDLDKYVWPKRDDVAEVDSKFVFYGPISLLGNYPFYLKKVDKAEIIKKYKEMKNII